ncbi:hypothetical protein FGB62_50g214 [Gracilaria domingensis]|nr:hypothetical protein FGB62_50g214 [Gracilaria domingensis]
MNFPLWTEGLTRGQVSHVVLLLIRIILVAVPVYLETRLISQGDPELVSRTVPDGLIPEPTDDWLMYQNTWGEDIYELRSLGLKTYLACTNMEEDGWVWAKVANVTYTSNSQTEIRCVSNTRRPVYRLDEEIIDYLAEDIAENVTLAISVNQGRVEEFLPDLVLHGTYEEAKPGDEAFRVVSARVVNDTDLECFLADSVKAGISCPVNGRGSIEWRGWCQRVEGRVVRFYSLRMLLDDVQMSNDSSIRGAITARNGTLATVVRYRGNFEFKDRILLNAQHLANVDPGFGDSAHASDVARLVLYAKSKNNCVQVPSGLILERTEIELDMVFIGVAEIMVVVILAMLLQIGSRSVWTSVQEPNTVGGLSRFWAQYEELGKPKLKRGQKWVTLKLYQTIGDEGKLLFVPLEVESTDEEELGE